MSPVRLIVELSAEEPVTGWIERAGRPREPFEGLLEMLAAFDRVRFGEPASSAQDASEPPAASED